MTLSSADKAKFELIARNALLRLATDAGISIPNPVILWNLKGKSAVGMAIGAHTIRLHAEAAALLGEQYAETVIHEACHTYVEASRALAKAPRTGSWSSHGHVWKQAMRSLGLRPDRCASISASALTPARTVKMVTVRCNCTTHEITQARMKNLHRLHCKACKSHLQPMREGTVW